MYVKEWYEYEVDFFHLAAGIVRMLSHNKTKLQSKVQEKLSKSFETLN